MLDNDRYISQILTENFGRIIIPIVKERPDLIGKQYNCIFDHKNERLDLKKKHTHEIKEAFEVSDTSFNWCKNDYIWEGLVLKLKDCYYKTPEDTIHNFLFVGNLKEVYIGQRDS